MSWFRKKRQEVVDLTYLAKRGLIKPKEEFSEILPQQQSSNSSSSDSSSALGFLGAIASSSEASKEESSGTGINKNKIEDIEYKLEIISKRVNAMLDRLDLVEKKLARDLRQGAS